MTALSPQERAKFSLLADGLRVTNSAQSHIDGRNHDRPMTPADYASTSGVILEMPGNVWVNAPVARHNPNFVTDPAFTLDLDDDQLVLRSIDGSTEIKVAMWIPPAYHGEFNGQGEEFNSYAFTHADRVRISPVEGCSMACRFCDLPFEFRYRTKRIEGLVDSVRVALADPIQPAGHVLISGGTPRSEDVGYVKDVYEAVITGFPDIPVDVMMVPIDTLIEPEWLGQLGVNELSVNIEIWNLDIARRIMRQKYNHGRDNYLAYLAHAVEVLGDHRVRSMLMVGLEPMEDTLDGVTAMVERGVVPVLSPFRPDPSTPMRNEQPPSADFTTEVYLRALDIANAHGVPLGPSCAPCSHNTLTLATAGNGTADRFHAQPFMI
jgi:hypothetical protein